MMYVAQDNEVTTWKINCYRAQTQKSKLVEHHFEYKWLQFIISECNGLVKGTGALTRDVKITRSDGVGEKSIITWMIKIH